MCIFLSIILNIPGEEQMKFFLSIITLSKKQQLPYLKMKSYTLTFKKMVTNLKVLHKSIILMLGICASGKHKYFDKLMFRQIFTCLKFCFSGVFFYFLFQISTCYFIWKKLAICTICMSQLYMPESYPSIVYYVTSTYFCFMLYVNYKLYFSISTKKYVYYLHLERTFLSR